MTLLFPVVLSWLPQTSWDAFKSHRKELKRPITAQGETRLLAKLKRFHDEGQDLQAVLDRSMENGWTGVFAIPCEESSRQSLRTRATLAWAEVREAIRAGRGKVWADAATADTLALIGGWPAMLDLRSDQAEFKGREFQRVFVTVVK